MSGITNLYRSREHIIGLYTWRITMASLAGLIAGCGAFPVFPTQSDYANPDNSLVFMYIQVDATSWTPSYVYLRKPDGGRGVILSWLANGSKKAGDCYLYAGAIPRGTYEFDELPGTGRDSYVFPKNSQDGYVLKVNKPDVHDLGQYALSTTKKSGAFSSGSFTFKPATGCPGDKAAYKAILNNAKNNSTWKSWIEDTRWYAILVKKSS